MKMIFAILLIASMPATRVDATVTVITNKAQWQAAVGPYSELTFTEFPSFTTITNQYLSQGIQFTDGNDFIFATATFPIDGKGLVSSDRFGNLGTIHTAFSQPTYSLGFEYLGGLQIELYSQGHVLFTSQPYLSDFVPFVGLVSTTPFDAVRAWDVLDDVIAIDNLYFGPPIPAPGVLAIFALGGAMIRRRSR